MPLDADFFDELRQLSEDRLQQTRARHISPGEPRSPHAGYLCEDGQVSRRFLGDRPQGSVCKPFEPEYKLTRSAPLRGKLDELQAT